MGGLGLLPCKLTPKTPWRIPAVIDSPGNREIRLVSTCSGLRGAILAISAAPMYAEARQPSADTLKAEARSFVKIISGDKHKSRTYCKIVELNDELDEKEDPIDARKLKKKREKLEEKLGRKYIALIAGLTHIDKDTRDYRAIVSVLEPLEKLCTAIKKQHRRRAREEHPRRVLGE